MLKTNSKKARENIRAYIMDNQNVEEYAGVQPESFEVVATAIYKDFQRVYNSDWIRKSYNECNYFAEWAAGLPGILDTCYYYNRSAVDDLAAILEESETEKAKYNDEYKAEKILSTMIYKEIARGASK